MSGLFFFWRVFSTAEGKEPRPREKLIQSGNCMFLRIA